MEKLEISETRSKTRKLKNKWNLLSRKEQNQLDDVL